MRTHYFKEPGGYILSKANKSLTIKKLNKAGRNEDKLKLMDKIILKCTKNLVKISVQTS